MCIFNILHFTDLHIDLNNKEWHWPSYKKLLFEDFKRLAELSFGPCDLILFSGDLTQSAIKEQFDKVSEVLTDVQVNLKTMGSKPYLLCVPGNHDLVRPAPTNSVVKALKQWHSDQDIRNSFWNHRENEYHQVINEAFSNYLNWWNNIDLPKPPNITYGIMPGDFSVVIEKGGKKIGVVGLNSAFLQLTADDYEKQLDINEEQLYRVTGNDPDKWCMSNDLSLLMTHHNEEFFHEDALSNFYSKIYIPERFYCHIHGHLHTPSSLNFRTVGSEERRRRQGPSLFGRKYWGKENNERIYGFIAEQFDLSEKEGVERLWPRHLVSKIDGQRRFEPDLKYNLDEQHSIPTKFPLKIEKDVIDKIQESEVLDKHVLQHIEEFTENNSSKDNLGIDVSLVDKNINLETAKKFLKNISRHKFNLEPNHSNIRLSVQARFEAIVQKDHCVWLICDWGHGKEGFLSSIFDRLSRNGIKEVFRLICDDVSSFEDFEAQVVKQFGMTIQEYCTYISVCEKSLLIIDDVSADFIDQNSNNTKVINLLASIIIDFCPNLFLVFISRKIPSESNYEFVQLKPLDISEVANYILNHPKSGSELSNSAVIDEIFIRSEGLPMLIDRLIETLQVASVKELVDLDLDLSIETMPSSEPVPKALKQAIALLASPTASYYSRRSYKMLKVLSFLPEGASLQAIKRIYPSEPFYPNNALELKELSLLKVETFSGEEMEFGKGWINHKPSLGIEDKRLFVPRQVRDYVCAILIKDEQTEIIKALTDLLFGVKWREGNIRLFQANTIGERGIRSNGPGNEHAVIKKLLWDAIQRNDDHIINLSLRLGVNYSTKLKESCRYRDACVATGELLSLITGLNLDNQHVELSILRGQSLRMVGQMEDALEVLYSAIEMGNGFIKNKSLSDVYLSIALIHDKSGNKQDVIIAANKVQELTQKDSGKYLQAEAIKARYIDDISLKKNKLFELEQKARNTNHNIVANNIAVELARSSKNKNEKLSLFEKVISCNEDPYNRIRATISKSMYLINEDRITEINKKDIQFLGFAYSFLFAQRMSVLFNDCHIVIWTLLKSEGNIIKLLRAFRLSSFLWRIRGEEYLEKKYLEDIDPQDIKNIYDTRNENTMIDINYFERRRQLMLI